MKPKKVLIVDDEEVIRKILRIALAKWGFLVEEADDGLQAYDRLKKETYDLMICDIVMPKLDGWELIKKVRVTPGMEEVPIIALTSKTKDSDMFRGYELGANYYITKPFTKAQIQYGIRLVLSENPTGTASIDVSAQAKMED